MNCLMKSETKKVSNWKLFLTFMKLGLFSFGGGPAMLMLIKEEIVTKNGWMSEEELTEMVGLSESTPGPIAVNLATYLGYRKHGFLGALCATLGVMVPTFLIMFIVSMFFRNLMQYEPVQYAFIGVKCAVVFLILRVAISLAKHVKSSSFAVILFLIVAILMIVFHYLNIDFSAIYFILIGLFLGLLVYSLIIPLTQKHQEEVKK